MSRSSVWLPDGTKRLWPPHDDHGALQDALDEKKRAARAEAAAKGRATGSGSAAGVWQARTTTKWSFKPAVSKRAYTPPPPPPPLKRPTAKGPEPTPAHELHELSTRLLSEADEILSTSAPEPLLVQLGSKCDSADAIKKVVKEWDNKGKGEMLKGALRNNLRNIGLTASGAEADAIFDSWDEVRASALTQCLGALDRARATSTLHSSTLERCLPRLFTPCPAHARRLRALRRAMRSLHAFHAFHAPRALQPLSPLSPALAPSLSLATPSRRPPAFAMVAPPLIARPALVIWNTPSV